MELSSKPSGLELLPLLFVVIHSGFMIYVKVSLERRNETISKPLQIKKWQAKIQDPT